MLIKIVTLFLLVILLLGLISGPALRRFIRKLLGLDRRDRD